LAPHRPALGRAPQEADDHRSGGAAHMGVTQRVAPL
jgi:hypothetical protein